MPIILVLVVIAALVVAAVGLMLVGSLIAGAVASSHPRARHAMPIFLVIIPITLLGAIGGGVVIGYSAVQANDHYIVLGPLSGIVLGSAVGLVVSIIVSMLWWRRL